MRLAWYSSTAHQLSWVTPCFPKYVSFRPSFLQKWGFYGTVAQVGRHACRPSSLLLRYWIVIDVSQCVPERGFYKLRDNKWLSIEEKETLWMSLWAKQERTNVCIDTEEAVWGKDVRAFSATGKIFRDCTKYSSDAAEPPCETSPILPSFLLAAGSSSPTFLP